MSEPVCELKSCPFCGRRPEIWFSAEDKNGRIGIKAGVEIFCKECDASIKVSKEIYLCSKTNPAYSFIDMERDAKKKWNKREGV